MKDRTFERGTGCWNCSKRFTWEAGKKWWVEERAKLGTKAFQIVASSPLGEGHPKVVAYRRWIALGDDAFRTGKAIHCEVGVTATNEQVGSVTPSNYMCSKWTGLPGSSLAKIDGRVDMLPEELLFEVDGGKPTVLEDFKAPVQLVPADNLVRRRKLV